MTVSTQAMKAAPTEILESAYTAKITSTSCPRAMIADVANLTSLNLIQM